MKTLDSWTDGTSDANLLRLRRKLDWLWLVPSSNDADVYLKNMIGDLDRSIKARGLSDRVIADVDC